MNGKQESINASAVFRKPSSTQVKLVAQEIMIYSMEPKNFSIFEVIIIYDKFKVILFNSFSIVEISTASPSGMQITSLRNHGQIYYRNVTWYPSQHQIGQQLFCFVAKTLLGKNYRWYDLNPKYINLGGLQLSSVNLESLEN